MIKKQYLQSLPRLSSRDTDELLEVVAKLGLPASLSMTAAAKAVQTLQTAYQDDEAIEGFTVATLRDIASWFEIEVDNKSRKPALIKAVRPFFLSAEAIRSLPEEDIRNASSQLLQDWCATAQLWAADDQDECMEQLLIWRTGRSIPPVPIPSDSDTDPWPRDEHAGRSVADGSHQSSIGSEPTLPISLADAGFLETSELLHISRLLPTGKLPSDASRAHILSALLNAKLVGDIPCAPVPPRMLPKFPQESVPQRMPWPSARVDSDFQPQAAMRPSDRNDGNPSGFGPHVEDTRVLSLLTRDVPHRFSDLLGPQGKYSSDAACGNCQVYLHPDDRRVMGVQKTYLKFLLGLLFVMDFSPTSKSPSGTHLQAFNGLHGDPFRYVYQIHTALSRLARVLDALVCQTAGSVVFQPVFDPLLRLLQSGDVCGLQRLPVDTVIDAVSEALLKMGHAARSAEADSWTRETLILKLRTAATVDVTAVIQRASLLTLSHVRDYSRDQSRKRPRSPSRSPGGLLRPSINQAKVSRPLDRHNLCMAALRKHLRLADKGCSRSACPYAHDFAKASKDTMLQAAESFYRPELRAKAKAAVLSLQDFLSCEISHRALNSPALHPPTLLDNSAPLTPPSLSHGTKGVLFIHKLTPMLQRLWLSSPGHCESAQASSLDLQGIVLNCIREFSPMTTTAQAQAAAGDFEFPAEVHSRDLGDLRRVDFSLTALVSLQQQRLSPNRFNTQRCAAMLSSDSEYSILSSIASKGVPIDRPTLFQPVTSPPPRRRLHSRLLHVYRHHAFQLWSAGHALLLPTTTLRGQAIHYNPAHWTSKPGKPLGRFLCDCSNGSSGETLNSESLLPVLAQRFGDLTHPTIVEIVAMIYRVADREGGLSNLLLWKEDIAGAFSHFNYDPNDASLLAIEIDDVFTLIHTSGMFGWSGSPYAFGPFSRALQRLTNQHITGESSVYVDDFMGASSIARTSHDQQTTQRIITSVLGPHGINLDKSTAPCRSAEFIGWLIDLDTVTIRPNDRGIRKLTAAFFGYDFGAGVKHPLVVYQKLASLATRYSTAIFAMRPFVYPLVALTAGRGPRSTSADGRLAVLVWRSVILALLVNRNSFSVPLRTLLLSSASPSWIITSDAGPWGLGVAVMAANSHQLKGFASLRLPFDASAPDFQNAREFLGLLFGLLLCHHTGLSDSRVAWYGDNQSSLSWVRKQRSSSRFAQSSFYAFTWLCLRLNIEVQTTVHVAGIHMGNIDSLSRFKEHSLPPHQDCSIDLAAVALQLFCVLNPTLQHSNSTESHLDSFLRVADVILNITRDR